MVTDQDILDILSEVSNELNPTLQKRIAVELGRSAPLYGRDGVLDSLGLVSFLSAVEQTIEDRFNMTITIASERAISQQHSPFRTLGMLSQYVAQLVQEAS